jgi:5-methylcytosine-specific restriction endonuclease McrA
MIQPHVGDTKRVRLYKDGPVLDTPDHASWRPRSMTNSRCEDDSTDGVVCPACGRESTTHQGYAIHYSKTEGGGHTGNPTVARFGRERLTGLYWQHGYEEIAEILNIGSTTVANTYDELNLPKKTEYNRVAWEHGVSKTRLAYHLHYDAEMTTSEMSDALGVSRTVIDKLFEKSGVNSRTQGEAAKLAWEHAGDDLREKVMSPEFREHQQREELPEELHEWREENAEKLAEYAALGTPAREENGMKGATGEDNPQYNRVTTECANCGDTIHRKPSRAEEYDELYCGRACQGEHRSERFTGQDHPNWRGGTHLIDAVKKQLQPPFSVVRDECRDDECKQCGSSDTLLDTHHIIPVSAGGTNEKWNLMTLCRTCHPTAESYVRQFEAFDSVLTE